MRQSLLIANWKMQGTRASTTSLLTDIKAGLIDKRASVVILPPVIFLAHTEQLLKGSTMEWGGQNMASVKEGAYTGEISGAMLKEFGCRYVLIGHSERRTYYGESDTEIVQKCKLAKVWGLTPILCVGESLAQYQAGQSISVVTQQLMPVLALGAAVFEDMILAYEPVWAIGTGLNASPEQAQAVHLHLRHYIAQYYPALAHKLRILYGGSIKPSNAQALFAMPDVDGGLVGGASLNAQSFLKIYHTL